MERIPLFFKLGGLVAGRGFIALVAIEGRCILERTGKDFVSFLGVNPGAAAGQGDTEGEAYQSLAAHIRQVVSDFAAEAAGFQQFKAHVEHFVLDTNRPFEAAWHAAVADVRAGTVDRSRFAQVFNATRPPAVTVELVAEERAGRAALTRELGPDLNLPGEEPLRVAVA